MHYWRTSHGAVGLPHTPPMRRCDWRQSLLTGDGSAMCLHRQVTARIRILENLSHDSFPRAPTHTRTRTHTRKIFPGPVKVSITCPAIVVRFVLVPALALPTT